MKTVKPLVLLAVFFVAGCSQPYRPIPPGTYRPAAGEERIVVTPSRIWFHVNVDKEKPDVIGSREYPYEVMEDGDIYFAVSSNSTFGLRLRMDYSWGWTGQEIVKTRFESGEETRFLLRN